MTYYCFSCSKEVDFGLSQQPPRTSECDSCRSDLHVCKNCEFYDTSAYNECKESQAERVVDKEKANFCDYFKYRSGKPGHSGTGAKDDALKKLDDLFK